MLLSGSITSFPHGTQCFISKHRWNARVCLCCECYSKRKHRHTRVNWHKSNFYFSLFRSNKRASVTQCHWNKFSYFNARHSEASCSFVPSNERSAWLECVIANFPNFQNLPIQKSASQCALVRRKTKGDSIGIVFHSAMANASFECFFISIYKFIYFTLLPK